ncbi:MAG: UDP-2,3-diacylglucosamine diphosphatase [Planctomycetota bacterium]|jgi:UDP-2,3-diacylglucosamine pyrophosphatase LpxH
MRTLILSDIHLGSRHCNHRLVNELLDKEVFDRLVLNGDTIHNVNLRKLIKPHWELLDRFRKIGRDKELILLRGNHDHEFDHFPGKPDKALDTSSVLPALLATPMREDFRLPVNGHEYLILHGDRFDPTMNYPVVTEVAFLAYQFTTKFNKKLAKWLKRKSKKWGGILELVRDQAVAFAQRERLAGVITGHTHFAEDVRIHDVHYLNTGSWTESPCAYITADNAELTLHHMSD